MKDHDPSQLLARYSHLVRSRNRGDDYLGDEYCGFNYAERQEIRRIAGGDRNPMSGQNVKTGSVSELAAFLRERY